MPCDSFDFIRHCDYTHISDYAKLNMAICYEMGLIKGHDNGLIEPKGNLTRAQLASVMMRLLDYIDNIEQSEKNRVESNS